MRAQPRDIYAEPDADPDTLRHLGPLRALAGIFEGTKSLDVNPGPDGTRRQAFVERIELQPIDPQTNGPQLFYGLCYLTRIVKPGEVETYHHQTGHWLWEPTTGTVIQTISIPRGLTALALGKTTADATRFALSAVRGSTVNGICANPFLDEAFRTESLKIAITVNPDGSWAYEEDSVLRVEGLDEPFHHTDANLLRKVAEPTPNPLMRKGT
ncbi:MAG: heme-binding beta-barrel domain-containing protein [Geminicoccaceae bacterium]